MCIHINSNRYCNQEDITELGSDSVCIDFGTILTQLKTDFKIGNDFLIGVPYFGHGGFKVDDKPRNVFLEKKTIKYKNFLK